MGYGLVRLVENEGKGDLVERIFQLRKEFAKDLGIVVPRVRIKDNLELQPSEYSILIKGVSVAKGELISGYSLAMDGGNVTSKVSGIDVREPVFGLPAIWVPDNQKEEAQMNGYTVVDHSTIMATHLSETIKKHAHELIGRQDLQNLIDNLQKTHPKVIEELIPNVLSLGVVLKVMQGLLKEQVPVRDILSILETLANYGPQTKDPEQLVEYVRSALSRTITHRLSVGSNLLEVMTFAPDTEEHILRAYKKLDTGSVLNLDPGFFEKLVMQIQNVIENHVFGSGNVILLCHPLVRGQLKRLLDRFVPNLNVVSANEIASFAKVKSIATVEA
ncbi:MAG: flagellar biosynthesis protein FlhA [Bdellovibrionota bacterium]